ncbi:MAG TPA: hypothetical protein VF614_13495 [Chthoniobacteraceae bacterium]|jgi:hypothetical protein
MNDADLEMAGLQAAADRESALRRKGICTHGFYMAPRGQKAVCRHCGAEFATEAELLEERAERLGE